MSSYETFSTGQAAMLLSLVIVLILVIKYLDVTFVPLVASFAPAAGRREVEE